MEERLKGGGDEILAHVAKGVATITLNRPHALNSLTYGMLSLMRDRLDGWEEDSNVRMVVFRGAGGKAFCAGGDIRALYTHLSTPGRVDHHRFFELEYALNYRIHKYSKTIVAVMDGIVMGGGMGISQGARVRIVGDRTKMAMPETGIGLFPDVGASYFLSRVPGKLGIYLGLTGAAIGAADAIYCGLADVFVGAPEPPRGELETLRPAIDRHFAGATVDDIRASLAAEDDPSLRDWARRTLDRLARASPTLLAVTLEQLRRGAQLSMADCFRMELNLIHACFEQGDMLEGIRALIIEKDNRPSWAPPGPVDAFFKPRWEPARHPLASLQ